MRISNDRPTLTGAGLEGPPNTARKPKTSKSLIFPRSESPLIWSSPRKEKERYFVQVLSHLVIRSEIETIGVSQVKQVKIERLMQIHEQRIRVLLACMTWFGRLFQPGSGVKLKSSPAFTAHWPRNGADGSEPWIRANRRAISPSICGCLCRM